MSSLASMVVKVIAPFHYGVLAKWAMLGLFIHQVYVYNTRFARTDPRPIKILVYVVLAMELIMTGFMTHLAHSMIVDGWGNPKAIIRLPWSILTFVPLTSLVASLVQFFFMWRLWKINAESILIRIVLAIVAAISLVDFGSSFALSYTWITRNGLSIVSLRQSNGFSIVIVLAEMTLAGAFVCDILITALMVISLLRLRKDSRSVKSTWNTLNTLIIRAVQTGAVTIVIAVIELILFSHPKMKDNASFIAFGLVLSNSYSTMLMANLNGRGQFSGASEIVLGNTRPARDIELTTSSLRIQRPVDKIMYSTEVETHYGSLSKAPSAY